MRNPSIERIEVMACRIPTQRPESDGTCEWDSTTIVIVHAWAQGLAGLGYTYADAATAALIRDNLGGVVTGRDAWSPPAAWRAMQAAVRNLGRPGISAMAISAMDCALWDLKARLLELPLAALLGPVRDGVPVYGSGGFTSMSDEALAGQLQGWVEQGIARVKMKVGRDPRRDPHRAGVAREAIGPEAALFIDANGAYGRKQALQLTEVFAGECGVSWFEEPVSMDDTEGLRLLRQRAPAGMDIAAGEYGYTLHDFRRLIEAAAVDCMQADVTRCGGVTGLMAVSAMCQAFQLPLSAHCAPAQHIHAGCAIGPLRHLEYFHDHVRIENMLFDGVSAPLEGVVYPNLSQPGMGLSLRRDEAARYAL